MSLDVDAYNELYASAMEYLSNKQDDNAKVCLIKAAEIANRISETSTSLDVKNEYHLACKQILEFIRLKFGVKEKEKEEGEKHTSLIEEKSITFKDVAGLDDVKEEIIYNVLEPLKNPELAKQYGVTAGAKILLYGPPGTGKTFIARAIAGEVDAKFYAVNCQDLISKYLGESSKKLDELFETALKNKRAIIFFDEIDSIGGKRENDSNDSGEMSRFVSTFLTKIDGFKKSSTNEMLLLIGATNRPWALDTALVRGGRFDTHIFVGTPDFTARKFLIEKNIDVVNFEEGLTLEYLAELFEGFGGGDIVSMCSKIKKEAYKLAIQTNKHQPITRLSCEKIALLQKNVITKEELQKFELFRNGDLQ